METRKTFAICNLGCKVNNYEANWYQQELSKKYDEVDFDEVADIYVINSCTVTNTAGSKSRQMMHRARKKNPDAVLCVVSCYVQMEYTNPDIFADCDILIGAAHKKQLPELIDRFLENGEKVSLVSEVNQLPFEEMHIESFNQTRAYLKIQDGCNQFCTYCTIPYARGRERSLDADEVIATAGALVSSGHKEIVLTGIHTGRYHDGTTDFTALVERLFKEVDGLERLRISSIEMTEVTDRLIQLMNQDERLAHHLHIPLQAGSDEVLKAMRRPYDSDEYILKVQEIRNRVPGISVSSDVIVGFPGETDQQFAEGCEVIRKAGLSFLHVFPYAAKKGTLAAGMKEQIPAQEKRRRVGELTKLSDGLYNDFISCFISREGKVLLEKSEGEYLQGHNSEYVLVKVKGDPSLLHEMVKVRYTDVKGDCLIGEVI